MDEPGIESTPGVCGGKPCVAGTRIPVWLLEQYRRSGATTEILLANYPTICEQDIINAWHYADRHPEEIERQIRANEEA